MLGGSSGVNGFQAHRPQKEDIDAWGAYFGESSEWSWEGLLPYFKKVRQTVERTEELLTSFSRPGDSIRLPPRW